MTAIRLKTAAIVYGALAVLAVVVGFVRENPDIFHHPEGLVSETFPLGGRILLGGGAGVAFGLGIAWISRYTPRSPVGRPSGSLAWMCAMEAPSL